MTGNKVTPKNVPNTPRSTLWFVQSTIWAAAVIVVSWLWLLPVVAPDALDAAQATRYHELADMLSWAVGLSGSSLAIIGYFVRKRSSWLRMLVFFLAPGWSILTAAWRTRSRKVNSFSDVRLASRTMRRWPIAAHKARITMRTSDDQRPVAPIIAAMASTASGLSMVVGLIPGQSDAEVRGRCENIASALGLGRFKATLRVSDDQRQGYVKFDIVVRDPLAQPLSTESGDRQ